jgi:hypothetical protein
MLSFESCKSRLYGTGASGTCKRYKRLTTLKYLRVSYTLKCETGMSTSLLAPFVRESPKVGEGSDAYQIVYRES